MFAALLARQPAFAALLAAGMLLAGCRESPDDAPPLRIIAIGAGTADALAAENIGVGLTTHDAAGLVIPGLAQSWRVADDGRAIVFRLRHAQYSDGRTVAATDVVSTIRRIMRQPPDTLRDLVAGIEAVSSPLPDVVELLMTTPQPEMLELLAHPAFAIQPGARDPVRAGPFMPDDTERAERPGRHLLTQPHFFDADEHVAHATIITQPVEAAIRIYQELGAEIVTGGGLDGLGLARSLGASDTLRLETSRSAMLLLVNHKQPPLDDRRVRIALAVAIDRDRLGPALFGSASALPVHALAPSGLRQSITGAEPDWVSLPLAQRRAEALRLLEESGFNAENPLTVDIAVIDTPADVRLITAVAEDLAQVGVRVRLGQRQAKSHAGAVERGDYQLALVTRSTPIASVLPFLGPMRCGRNPAGVCIPEADRLLDESWKATTPAERALALASAERLWAEDGAVIGLVQPLRWSLVSRRVRGWTANEAGVHPLRFLTIVPERKMLP